MREQITIHNFANTAPVINWLKLNNSGEKLLTLVSSINTPGIAAAIVTQQYNAKENDEISLQIGDLISIIEMPESSKSIWWRGKRGFEVGFFPSSCVELIGSNILNENENLLVYLLKCKQQLTEDDDKLSNLNKTKEFNQSENNTKEDNFNNLNKNSNYKNDKKLLIECQTNSLNSMNNKQHNTTPKINLREIRSISPIQNTDHHTPQTNYSTIKQRNLFLKSSTKDNQKILTNNTIATNSSSVFQRRNRISYRLPKSLNSTIISKPVQEKPICVNLFNQTNLSFDLPSTVNLNSPQQTSSSSFNQQQLNNSSINRTNDSTMGNNNKRGNKLSSFLRSIINRNNSNQENQYDKRSNNAIKRNDKSNVLINLRKNKKILIKNTVFGCELNDYLNRTGRKIPLVLKSCCDFLESNGVVHGIYRLSGVNSNIQRLIKCFNDDEVPDFNDDIFLQDVHCVSSLLKLYFRELPNPLLTFELYENFVKAINPSYDSNAISTTPDELPENIKLANLIKVLKLLPLNHYITLEYLVRHLNKIASYSDQTGMTIKNLGIVWSPNLLRSKELEIQGGIGALQCISVQAILTEYLIRFVDELFVEESRPFNYFNDQENENGLNDSIFLSKNTLSFNQSNYSSPNQNNSNQFDFRKDLNKQSDENHFQSNDNQLSDNSMDENKFPLKQDDNLITLQEAQSRWKKKSKLLDEDKTIDQLISSNFNIEDDHDETNRNNENTNSYITGLSCLSFNNKTNNNQENQENDENKYGSQKKRFGNLDGEQVFTGTRKRFGNLDLVDETDLNNYKEYNYKENKSFVSKRRNLFEQGLFNKSDNEEDIFKINKFKDRYRYKNFDEHSGDELENNLSKSNNSLKFIGKEEDHEPIKRYHTILNPKDFNKNRIIQTSTPKELNSNRSKWKM